MGTSIIITPVGGNAKKEFILTYTQLGAIAPNQFVTASGSDVIQAHELGYFLDRAYVIKKVVAVFGDLDVSVNKNIPISINAQPTNITSIITVNTGVTLIPGNLVCAATVSSNVFNRKFEFTPNLTINPALVGRMLTVQTKSFVIDTDSIKDLKVTIYIEEA